MTRRNIGIAILLIMILLVGAMLASCESAPAAEPPASSGEQEGGQTGSGASDEGQTGNPSEEMQIVFNHSEEITDFVMIEMESGGKIVIRLLPEYAPITVANFQKLVKQGFYDGLIFHRVIEGFMIQGGDPLGTGAGGSGETIKGEFVNNGVANYLGHFRGMVSMARSGNEAHPELAYDTASSQFFICHADCSWLNGDYAAFGVVVDGMDTVDAIASVETGTNDRPLVEQKMKKISFVVPEIATPQAE